LKCVVIAALFAGLIDSLVGDGGWMVTIADRMLLPLAHERGALKVYTQPLECVRNQDMRLDEYTRTMIVEQ